MTAPLPMTPTLLRFLQQARVGRLATVDAAGLPSVVPICYQVAEGRLFTPIDAKPKRADWRRLQRVRNLLARPHVAVVVDRWSEDWRRLGWVHLRGEAALLAPEEALEVAPTALHAQGVALLRAKYAQYRAMALERRPLIVVTLTGATHWGDLSPPDTP